MRGAYAGAALLEAGRSGAGNGGAENRLSGRTRSCLLRLAFGVWRVCRRAAIDLVLARLNNSKSAGVVVPLKHTRWFPSSSSSALLAVRKMPPPPASWRASFSALEAMYEKHFKGGESPSIGQRAPVSHSAGRLDARAMHAAPPPPPLEPQILCEPLEHG
jgi:hypothetical protein